MGDTNIGNIIARVGADASPMTEELKKAQNTILTFKDESLAALKSFGLPHISSTNLVEAIQSGQRVVVNFARESNESLAEFQQRVRATFEEAGIDITGYEKVLEDADKIHAEFAKGAVKNFQAISAAAEEVNNKADELKESLGQSFNGITANFGAFKDALANAFKTLGDGSASAGDKFAAVSNAVTDGFGLMTGAVEVFLAVELVKKVGEWINSLQELASETQDAEHRFYASMGSMSDEAEKFSQNLSESYGIDPEAIQNMMGKEYMNTRMLGFDPTQSEKMSEHITQLSYDLGKLRGIDPSQAFDALQRGIEGQTRGLMDLGLRITQTDLKNRALSEGLIKQGQTMTTAQTSAVAYQMIMEKLQGVTGYYKTTADDLSTQQAKLSAGWDEMKRKLAEALTPAMTGFMKVVNFLAIEIEQFVEQIATGIQYISLFAEDAYSAVNDILSLNFGQISKDWDNNYNSIFNANEAAKQFGASLDDNMTPATDAQTKAQKALHQAVNANVMSFDQLHNLTNSGAAGALVQADAVNNLANALTNLKNSGLNNITNTQAKGIVIPVSFKIPPFPPIPQPPAVTVPVNLQNNLEPGLSQAQDAVKNFNPANVNVPVTVEERLEPGYSQAESKLKAFNPPSVKVPISVVGQMAFNNALQSIESELSQWRAGAYQVFNQVRETALVWESSTATTFNKAESVISTWATNSAQKLSSFASGMETTLRTGFNTAGGLISQWALNTEKGIDSMVANAGTTIATFKNNLHNDFNQVFQATEQMAVSWANSIGQTITAAVNQAASEMQALAAVTGAAIPHMANSAWQTVTGAYQSVANWAENNKSWLVPAGVAAGAVGLTVATGGADLMAAGIAVAGSALAGLGASLAVPAMASGGIVTAPMLAMIGDGKGPEAVIPLEKLGSVLGGSTSSDGGVLSQSSSQPINVTLMLDGRILSRILYSYTVNENDRQGRMIGYNSSYNLPK